MDLEELTQYIHHGKLCVDLCFDEDTRVIKAVEITKQKTDLVVNIRYLPYETLHYIPSEPLWNLDGAETLARIRGRYYNLESLIGHLEPYLGASVDKWLNYSRSGYYITLQATQLSMYMGIDWNNWRPVGNQILVPNGSEFTIITPTNWVESVSLVTSK